MSYYDEFKAGWVPDELDLEGDWAVRGLIGPLPVRFLGHTKQFVQQSEGVYSGNNLFLGKLAVGHYEASAGPSQVEPELNVVNINYNVPRNLWVMRGLTDEVRFVEENKMLGRGIYKPAGMESVKPRNIFWFTVTKL